MEKEQSNSSWYLIGLLLGFGIGVWWFRSRAEIAALEYAFSQRRRPCGCEDQAFAAAEAVIDVINEALADDTPKAKPTTEEQWEELTGNGPGD